MKKTSIEWTEATWNPIRGCSRVSEGCRNCYAEKVAYRFSGPGQPYEGLVRINASGERKPEWNGQVQFVEKHLLDPLKWKGKPLFSKSLGKRVGYASGLRIFVNSMSDLFHENVPDEWIDRIFAVMALCPQHIFQVLTKRPQRMLEYLSSLDFEQDRHPWGKAATSLGVSPCAESMIEDAAFPLPNVWLGVSVEDQKAADERIPLLLQTPAAVRFISAEPLLGPIDLTKIYEPEPDMLYGVRWWRTCLERGDIWQCDDEGFIASSDGPFRDRIDWVIVGGESGPGARSCNLSWLKSIVDDCAAAKVPCFVKQLGAHPVQTPSKLIHPIIDFQDRKGGDWSEWPDYLRVREFPA